MITIEYLSLSRFAEHATLRANEGKGNSNVTNRLTQMLGDRDWLLADGATGTSLFNMGLEAGKKKLNILILQNSLSMEKSVFSHYINIFKV